MPAYKYFDLQQEQIGNFTSLCPLNEYRVIAPSQVERELLGFVPEGLWKKTDHLFLMSSGSAVATTYCMANCGRYDHKAFAIDQEPIFFAHVGGEPRLDGIIIHHGNWKGRTTPVPQGFHDYLINSGIGNHYPCSSIPATMSGLITELTSYSQKNAFETGVKKIIQLAQQQYGK